MILNLPAVEIFCINSCFVLLLITTFYYWSKILFVEQSTYSKKGLFGYGLTLFFLTTLLILRWIDSGHFPLSNLYESLLFLAWCFLVLQIYIESSLKTMFLGVLLSPALLCLIAFTDFSLPEELQKSAPLVPALQSNWLVMHVTVMIGSYAALLLGSIVSVAYLIFSVIISFSISKNLRTSLDQSLENSSFKNSGETLLITQKPDEEKTLNSFSSIKSQDSGKILDFLDNLSYRTIGIGFCFLTLGILSGAIWANETWGNYWSWDPKETWAFITWLTFAAYLHSRLIGGWKGSKPAWIASFGFVIIWICYLGVNLLGQGLHSYGFLQI